MPSLNVNNLEILATNQISTISGSTCNLDLLTYAVTVKELRTGGIFTASSVSTLPTASTSTGTLYFVDSERTIYFASTSSGWVPLVTGTANELWGAGIIVGDGTLVSRCSLVREFCSASDWCYISNGSHALAIKTNGQMWGWGNNVYGHIGDGTTITRCSPVREFCSAFNWCKVSIGEGHSIAIKTDGSLWGWGYNHRGQIGSGFKTPIESGICSPVREFCSATDWKEISAGMYVSGAIKTSGQLWTWGTNNTGQLGIGSTIDSCSPVREFCSATDWCQVSVGSSHAAAIKTSGQLWSWGYNSFGNLGDGTSINKCSPVREFCSANDWCQVSGACRSVSAIKTTGQLWSWGQNRSGKLGIGDSSTMGRCSPVREFCSATDWCQVSVGSYHAAAVKTTGQLWTWGDNTNGRLGIGSSVTLARCSPVREFCSATDWCQVSSFFTTLVIKAKRFE